MHKPTMQPKFKPGTSRIQLTSATATATAILFGFNYFIRFVKYKVKIPQVYINDHDYRCVTEVAEDKRDQRCYSPQPVTLANSGVAAYCVILIGQPYNQYYVECSGRVVEEFGHDGFHSYRNRK